MANPKDIIESYKAKYSSARKTYRKNLRGSSKPLNSLNLEKVTSNNNFLNDLYSIISKNILKRRVSLL